MKNLLTVSEAAKRLGVHRSRVHALIREGRLPVERLGHAYVIVETDLKLVADRKPGRPPKQTSGGKKKASDKVS